MRFRPANISLINRRHYLPRLLLTLSWEKSKYKNHPSDSQMLTGHTISTSGWPVTHGKCGRRNSLGHDAMSASAICYGPVQHSRPINPGPLQVVIARDREFSSYDSTCTYILRSNSRSSVFNSVGVSMVTRRQFILASAFSAESQLAAILSPSRAPGKDSAAINPTVTTALGKLRGRYANGVSHL